MQRGVTGRYEITDVTGELVRAFIPAPLPPEPALDHLSSPCWSARCLGSVAWTPCQRCSRTPPFSTGSSGWRGEFPESRRELLPRAAPGALFFLAKDSLE